MSVSSEAPLVRFVVVGAGGFAREVLDVVDALNAAAGRPAYEVVGVAAEPAPDAATLAAYDVVHLGPPEAVLDLPPDIGFVIGIGSPETRAAIDERLRDGRPSPTLVHPSASLGRAVTLGPGTVVCSHVSITNHVTLGRHVHVNLNCTVGHDAVLRDHVTVSPLVAVSGNVRVADRAFLGTSCSLRQGVTVGADAVVGMGAAVVRDVPAGVTVTGVPAAPRG